MYLTIAQERKQKKAKFFFGENYTQANKNEVRYPSVIDNDHIIYRTKDVRTVFCGDNTITSVLATGKNKAVYLKPWQVVKIKFRNPEDPEKKVYSFLVKLDRKYFKSYYFKSKDIYNADEKGNFRGMDEKVDMTFDELLNAALLQNEEKKKVELCI